MKNKISLWLVLAFLSTLAYSQKLDMKLFENYKLRNIGPAGMSGRITSIGVVNEQSDIIYAGSASGGVWKSTNGGIKWQPIFNDQTTASIGAISIQQSNPSVIWVGTGEGNPRNSLNGGDGIYRSLDAGKTWKKMGLAKTRHIHRIVIDPTNPNVVYVAAIGSPWGIHPERGVYKTVDGGKTWKKVLFVNNKTGCADLIIDPMNPNKLIAAMWEHKRDPWFFKSGGKGSGLYITHDGGENWVKKTDKDGLPKGELGRIGIAIATSKPNVVYALVEAKKNALYKSTDGGNKWKMVNNKKGIGNRPFYYSEIYVDPTNENRLYSIFTYVNVSEDGGKSFKQLMPAYGATNGVHPDHHSWWIHPKNPNYMIDGNDGGLNITKDGGKSWRFVENLPVGQFYHIAVDNEIPYNIYGGMQDNGSWAGPAYVWKAQGIRNHYWQEISFGDGFDVIPDPRNSRYGISTSQQGYAGIYDRETGYFEYIRPFNTDDTTRLRYNWNVGMNRDPFDANTIYFGSQFVHKSTDNGQNWEIISPDLTTNDKSKQKQSESGGLTMDATGAENYCTIIVIEPSPIQKDLLWIGTDDGKVQLTKDGGKNWKNVAGSIPELPKGAWITQIKPSNKNKGEALLVANDYRRFNYQPYVYRTTDYGKTWKRIVRQSDVASYALCVVEDPEEKRLLFLGTDDGLYVSIDAGVNWTKWNSKGFPTTNAYDMVIHPREHDLVVGTFGRSIWVLDDIRPLRELARKGANETKKTLRIFTPPTAYLSASQQPKGTRFGADALFNGENRKRGAMLTYLVNPPKKEKKEEKKGEKSDDKAKKEPKYDSIQFEIFKGDALIRTVKWKAPKDSGIHRTYWRLGEKGIVRPSRKKSKNKNEPRGVTVLPGTYKVRFVYGAQKDSTQVEVKADPRLNITPSARIAKYNALKNIEKSQSLASEATKRIRESLKIAAEYKKKLEKKDKEQFKEQIKLCKTTTDSLNNLMNLFVGKEDKRQGITRNPEENINMLYGNANWYLNNASHAPMQTENKLVQKYETKLSKVLQKVNTFYQKNWVNFRNTVEKINLSPFKDYQPIKK